MRHAVLLALPLLAACHSYDPPMAGDHKSPKYQADLEKCQKQAAKTANQKANATPQSSVYALFQSDDPERGDVLRCMQFRGYKPAS